jgi:fructokinase
MYDAVALGELLIDFTYAGKSEAGMDLFEQNAGGAPANVLCLLANMGKKTAFIGKVGNDMHGSFLKNTLASANIDVSGLIISENVFTTLAFVELTAGGERRFSFARKPGADTCIESGELNMDLLRNTRIFCFGSLSLTDEPARAATLEAVQAAKKSGAIIAYDPNYRAMLWNSEAEAVTRMRSVLPYVDIIKISEDETMLLTDSAEPEAAAVSLTGSGISCAVVTLGENGAIAATNKGMSRADAIKCDVVDTTGAGDAFWGGFLYKLLECGKRPNELTLREAHDCAVFANVCAALCVQKRGAIPAMPERYQAVRLYEESM